MTAMPDKDCLLHRVVLLSNPSMPRPLHLRLVIPLLHLTSSTPNMHLAISHTNRCILRKLPLMAERQPLPQVKGLRSHLPVSHKVPRMVRLLAIGLLYPPWPPPHPQAAPTSVAVNVTTTDMDRQIVTHANPGGEHCQKDYGLMISRSPGVLL